MTAVATPADGIGFGARFLAPVFLGSMLNPVNSTMIATALAPIGRDYAVPAGDVAWLLSGLYLASAVAQPVMGRLADAAGPRRVYLGGLVLVGAAGLAGAAGPPFGWLVVVRVLIGIGTSTAYPAAISMIAAQEQRLGRTAPGRVLGSLAFASMTAATVGPLLGGLLVSAAGWPAVFAVNVPLAAIGFGTALRWLPPDPPPDSERPRSRFDVLGAVLFAAVVTTLAFLLMSLRWWLTPVLAALLAALACWERGREFPFLDLRVLAGNRPLLMTYLRNGLAFLGSYGVIYGLTQWLETARGLSSAAAGLVLLPMSVLSAAGAAWAARGRRVRGPIQAGAAVLLLAAGLLLWVRADSSLVLVVAVMAATGMASGLNPVGNQAAMYAQAPPGQVGVAAGLLRTAQYLGAILSASLLAFTLGSPVGDTGLHRLALAVAGVAVLLAAVVVFDRSPR
ncbi:MFS transporter [Amycolatopsis benzoatilytica]|uniref:MFS transporter n=1 Tax=Amycolatopsis benzoatilytica TaxID=346045 RepID=UPI00036F14AB|nr:MFS transporter [Amycolatopsis benzoatilytica]